MQLRLAAAIVATVAAGGVARADGTLSLRGAYYKERATRVAQPMIDAAFDVGEEGELAAHLLVDSISSASVAAGAAGESFDETRYEVGATYLHRLDRLRLGGGARFSTEPDYKSAMAHLRGEVELGQRNTTLGLNLAIGRDAVSNEGAQNEMTTSIDGVLYTAMGSVSLTQILSPVLVGQLTYDVVRLDGFQENPYRTVPAGGSLAPERVPETRLRHAAQGGLRWFVTPTRSTLIGSYRLYADDWGVVGHTPEARLVQELMPDLDVHLRYRYHRQYRADFYRTIYDSADPEIEPFLTDDVKLGRLTTQTLGARLEVALAYLGARKASRLGSGEVHLGIDYIRQTAYFGNAIQGQLAVTLPFDY